jgi:hypothetical protein
VLDQDSGKAYWNTYDHVLDSWNKDYFKDTVSLKNTSFQSKYSTSFSHSSEAQFVNFESSKYNLKVDTLENNRLKINLNIYPEQDIRRIEIYANKDYNFEAFSVNKQQADTINGRSDDYHIFKKRYSSRLLTYHVVNQEMLELEFIGEMPLPEFQIFETRFDLLQNEKLKVAKRQPNMIPKPFVVNDAIVIKRNIQFN